MKFYNDKKKNDLWSKIMTNKLSAIYTYNTIKKNTYVYFYKNGQDHNTKNAACIRYDNRFNRFKQFYLHGKHYGNQNDFTKSSWRKFVKLQVFL